MAVFETSAALPVVARMALPRLIVPYADSAESDILLTGFITIPWGRSRHPCLPRHLYFLYIAQPRQAKKNSGSEPPVEANITIVIFRVRLALGIF